MNDLTFFQYLRQKHPQGPVADFARDVIADKDMPAATKRSKDRKVWMDYLQSYGACTPAMEAFHAAFNEWSGEQYDPHSDDLLEERVAEIMCQCNRVIRSMPSPKEIARMLPQARYLIEMIRGDEEDA